MKSVCGKRGALFILDEVMSGMGRESPGSPRGASLLTLNRSFRDGLKHMPGNVSVITSHRTFKLLPRVSVGCVSLLDRNLSRIPSATCLDIRMAPMEAYLYQS